MDSQNDEMSVKSKKTEKKKKSKKEPDSNSIVENPQMEDEQIDGPKDENSKLDSASKVEGTV